MTRSAVLTERHGRVLVITMNRPDVRNAIDAEVAHGIALALDELDADDAIGTGVVQGAGGCFSAGMDLGAFARGEDMSVGDRGFAGITRRGAWKPLIAAVEGFAVAGGMEIALSCDLIVAGAGARMGIPEVQRSLVASGGALLRLPRRMPHHVVMEIALTGDLLPVERFHHFGVVNRIAEPGCALEVALALAGRLERNGPLALAATKEVLTRQSDWTADDMWDRQREITDPVRRSEDAREGAVAFKAKRAPVWRGR